MQNQVRLPSPSASASREKMNRGINLDLCTAIVLSADSDTSSFEQEGQEIKLDAAPGIVIHFPMKCQERINPLRDNTQNLDGVGIS